MQTFKLLLLSLLLFSSCSKEDISVFNDERHIYFNSIHNKHEYKYSFLYTRDDSVVLRLPVKFFGKPTSPQSWFLVNSNSSKTTANEGSEYKLNTNQPFKSGLFVDSLEVTLYKSERLNNSEQCLSIKLESNEFFTASVRDSLVMDIYFTNKIAQPSWWNTEVVTAYLGSYSDMKFMLFIEHIYAGDFGLLSESEKLHYARMFKNWLSVNPRYENGVLITVPVIG